MMQAFKYGFVTAVGYTFLIAATLSVLACIDTLIGNDDHEIYFTSVYLMFLSVVFVISFLTGFCFPRFLSRFITEYSKVYPNVPEKKIYDICRGKLLMKYFQHLACISFITAVPLFLYLPEKYDPIYNITVCSSITFLNFYFKYKKNYKNL